jgi:hypothetical protein
MIRDTLIVLPADPIPEYSPLVITSKNKIRRKNRKIGFTVRETIGMGIVNTRGISKLTKNTKVGDDG